VEELLRNSYSTATIYGGICFSSKYQYPMFV
jgi:hypothetical protein